MQDLINSIISQNPWITSELKNGVSVDKIAESIRLIADENDCLDNLIFELGLVALLSALKEA